LLVEIVGVGETFGMMSTNINVKARLLIFKNPPQDHVLAFLRIRLERIIIEEDKFCPLEQMWEIVEQERPQGL
jgi:hypothetical protein